MSSQTDTPRPAGSNAGRGFHYQDAVAATLAVRAWSQDGPFGAVIPEGRDDCELAGDTTAFVQSKSRRDHLGDFPRAQVVSFLAKLWDRHDAAIVKPEFLVLALERPVDGLTLTAGDALGATLTPGDIADTSLAADPRAPQLLPKTRILVAPNPMEDAVAILAAHTGGTPIASQLHYGEVLRRTVELSDANGRRVPGSYEALAKSDVQALVDSLNDVTSLQPVADAIAQGLCEPIDFLTALDDPDFYLGVDVVPGHLAAGLVAERPEARERVLDGLERRGLVLLTGPSGSGKSALMWEAARASRHAVRWYRVRRVRPNDVHLLVRLARALRASRASPVGFVLDDVGRGQAEGWDALAREPDAGAAIILLGSIRQEDLFLLAERSRATELRELGSDELAERLWRELRNRGATSWPGWREPWAASDGLLLEYVGLLTRGERLETVLREQVARRLREKRHTELDCLRLVSLAGEAGASVETARLSAAIGRPEPELSEAMQRLIDEHLVRNLGGGRLGGLHQLRSAALARLTHAAPPPSEAQSVARTAQVVPTDQLEGYVGRGLAIRPEARNEVVDGLARRLAETPGPTLLTAALRGLGQAHIVSSVRQWLPEAAAIGLPPTQITTAVMFAVAKTELPSLPQLKPLMDAAKALSLRSDDDPRSALLARLPPATLSAILSAADAAEITNLLGAIVGLELPKPVIAALEGLDLDLAGLPLKSAREVLDGAHAVHASIARAWVDRVGSQALLDKVAAERPWTISIGLRQEGTELVVAGDVCQVAAAQGDLHEDVVDLCGMLLAFAPAADFAVCRALAADGELAGLAGFPPLADKRLPRSAMLPPALPAWNRRWSAIAAQEVGASSISTYLAEGRDQLARLVPALEKTTERLIKGAEPSQSLLDELGAVHDASRAMTAPKAGEAGAETVLYVTGLQNVLFQASADLVRKFFRLPDEVGAFMGWTQDMREALQRLDGERWELLEERPTALLERLLRVVDNMRLVAGHASVTGAKPWISWAKLAKGAKLGDGLGAAARRIATGLPSQREVIGERVRAALAAAGRTAEVRVRPDDGLGLPWPSAEILVLDDVTTLEDVDLPLADVFAETRNAFGPDRRITVVPRVQGRIVGRLAMSGYETPFPDATRLEGWLTPEDRRLDERLCGLGQAVLDPLLEIDAARTFGLGGPSRPPQELATIATAHAALNTARTELASALGTDPTGVGLLYETLVDDVLSGAIDVAAALAAVGHNDIRDEALRVVSLDRTLLNLDAMAAGSDGLDSEEKLGSP